MIFRAFKFIYNIYNRSKKHVRSYYYFGRWNNYVHGKIDVPRNKKIKIGEKCSVNRGVHIQGFSDVRIRNRVVLSPNCMILDANLDHRNMLKTGRRDHIPNYVHIEDDVWIGAGAIILPGVTIGKRSIVAAGAVVTKSFPEGILIAGNPAKTVRKLYENE